MPGVLPVGAVCLLKHRNYPGKLAEPDREGYKRGLLLDKTAASREPGGSSAGAQLVAASDVL